MKYIKYDNPDEVNQVMVKLQTYHDANQDPSKPRIIDCVFQTWDGKFALTLWDGDNFTDIGSGEVVDNVDPPIIKEGDSE